MFGPKLGNLIWNNLKITAKPHISESLKINKKYAQRFSSQLTTALNENRDYWQKLESAW